MLKSFLKKLVIVAPAFLMVDMLHAQSADPIEGVALTLSHIDKVLESSKTSHLLEGVTLAESEQIDNGDIEAWTKAQIDSYTSASGLEFRLGYDRKYGTGSDDIYDDLYAYKNRFDAMISWNILRSGLVGRSSYTQIVELESQKLTLNELSAFNNEQIRTHHQMQEQVLDGYRNKIYTTQIELYSSLITLLNKLHSQGQATTMQIVQAKMQSEIASNALRETPIEVDHLFNITDYLNMQVVIDQQMVEILAVNSMRVEDSKLDEQIVKSEADAVSYWKEASVSPYAKAQHYSDTGFGTSRMTANLGVAANLPLFSGIKSKRAEVIARSSLASNSTNSTIKTLTFLIDETVTQLNKNLEKLTASANLEKLYRDQINEAYRIYGQKQLTMQELAQYYIELLTLHVDIIQLIDDRESLKTKLLLSTI